MRSLPLQETTGTSRGALPPPEGEAMTLSPLGVAGAADGEASPACASRPAGPLSCLPTPPLPRCRGRACFYPTATAVACGFAGGISATPDKPRTLVRGTRQSPISLADSHQMALRIMDRMTCP